MCGIKVVLLFSASCCVGFALECGINVNGSEEQFRELTNQCTVGNKTAGTEKPPRGTSEEEEDYDEKENSTCNLKHTQRV